MSPVGPGWAALLPSGRCWQRMGAPPYLLELCAAVAVTTVLLAAPTMPVLLAGLWWAGCAVPLVFIDAQVHRLPNVITLPAAAGVFALLTVDAAVTDRWERVLGAAICAAVATTVFVSTGLILRNRGMGLGHAKLILSVTALLGGGAGARPSARCSWATWVRESWVSCCWPADVSTAGLASRWARSLSSRPRGG